MKKKVRQDFLIYICPRPMRYSTPGNFRMLRNSENRSINTNLEENLYQIAAST